MTPALFALTPLVEVVDNRGNIICEVNYYRHPKLIRQTDERIEFHQFNQRNFLKNSADTRQKANNQINFSYLYDLLGSTLCREGKDNGDFRALNDIEGRLLFSIDANNLLRTCDYENNQSLGRTTYIWEKGVDGCARVCDYFEYAGNSPNEQNANLAGKCIRHYDTAGLLQNHQISLMGDVIFLSRRLVQHTEKSHVYINWDLREREKKLAPQVFYTEHKNDATGGSILSIDAKGHQQRFIYDISGQLTSLKLTIKGELEHSMIKSIEYSATGQKLREEQGNGVVIYYEYEPQTQRLIRFRVERPAHHLMGFKCFQDVRYQYDPVGNILCIRNDAEETRFWRNQKIEPEQHFTYDTLYQLASATGRELANIHQQQNRLPSCFNFDNSTYTHYRRTYTYDSSGNLIHIHHQTSALHSCYSTKLTVSEWSNRAVHHSLTANSTDVDTFFTPSGQQKLLLQGQVLSWTARLELQGITTESLREYYCYDSDSQRAIKSSQHHRKESLVIYLPNLELRMINNQEKLHVINLNEGHGNNVQVLHWEQGKPEGIDNNSIRYCINTLNDNSSLEIDGQGQLISQEEYYPYGGTSVWLAQSAIEAEYKTYRYSGKERDVTGLYYYGRRYYQPWIGRWLSADPGGTIDGLNLFRMTRNNPLRYKDNNGLNPIDRVVEYYQQYTDKKAKLKANEIYQDMSKGQKWINKVSLEPEFRNLDSFFEHTRQNMIDLKGVVGHVNDEASEFIDRFIELDFTLLHFSNQDFLKQPNRATFRSRNEVLAKNLVSACELNTTIGDINGLNTVGFAFFSLGIRNVMGKMDSLFGDNLYITPLDDVTGYKYMKYSHMAINDTLYFSHRGTNEARLREHFPDDPQGVAALKNEVIASSAIRTVYSYQDFRAALALRIVSSARLLSSESQRSIYNTASDYGFDQLISLFYRPQILVPKKLKSTSTVIK